MWDMSRVRLKVHTARIWGPGISLQCYLLTRAFYCSKVQLMFELYGCVANFETSWNAPRVPILLPCTGLTTASIFWRVCRKNCRCCTIFSQPFSDLHNYGGIYTSLDRLHNWPRYVSHLYAEQICKHICRSNHFKNRSQTLPGRIFAYCVDYKQICGCTEGMR